MLSAELRRDAVRAEEGDVGAESLDRAHGVGADGGGGETAHAPADEGERGVRDAPASAWARVSACVTTSICAADALRGGRELGGDGRGGRAGVEEDRAAEAVADALERAPGDGRLRGAVRCEPLGERRLGGALAVGRDRSAVDAAQGAVRSRWSRSRRTVSVVTSKRPASSTTLTRPSSSSSRSMSSWRSVAYTSIPSLDSHTLQHIPTYNKHPIRRFDRSCRRRASVQSRGARQARRGGRDRRAARAGCSCSARRRRDPGCRDPAAREGRRGLGLRGVAARATSSPCGSPAARSRRRSC